MTEAINQSVQRELDTLRREYEAQLGQRVAEVTTAWHAAARAPDRIAATRETAQLAHALAGTSSVLGLMNVGRAATALEEALDQASDGNATTAVDLALKRLIETAADVAPSNRAG
jgi:chemotaxis protein histidine kinase CheA